MPERPPVPHVAIVGGGFSGASAAVQLLRRSPAPVRVTVVEPREQVGLGLAYSATDPDHRLNAPVDRHLIDPDDPQELERWLAADGQLQRDPASRLPDGRCYPRRQDFGRFIAATVAACTERPDGAGLRHLRDEATALAPAGRAWQLRTRAGATLNADLLIVATGNPPLRLPAFVSEQAAARAGVIGNPLDTARLREVAPSDRVLVLGSGLTALDMLSTLLRRGHAGPITVVSRHGLRPCPQPAASELAGSRRAHDPFMAPGPPAPDFVTALGPQPRVRALLRALRERIGEDAREGLPWYAAFNRLRDGVWCFWPEVPEVDKRRFVRHLRVWYDVHRFLSPPQNEAMVRAAVRDGVVRFLAARVSAVDAIPGGEIQVRWREHGREAESVQGFDALVNCTGIDGSGAATLNPFLRALLDDGWLRPGPAGLGFAVDETLRAIGADGTPRDTLRVVGPPTVGVHGDPIGAAYIAMHLRRAMPGVIATLSGSDATLPPPPSQRAAQDARREPGATT